MLTPAPLAASSPHLPPPSRPSSYTHPPHTQGTSVPIAIPNLPRWQPGGPSTPPEPFIAPHLITARPDFGLDPAGGSPSACIKRDRLKVRNAVMRATGYLEGR